MAASVVWLRRDLRVEDQPALSEAVRRGGPVVPLFIWSPEEEGEWAPGGASKWWLHHSLRSLENRLRSLGSPLVFRKGPAKRVLEDVVREVGADAVFWNRKYEPFSIARDQEVKSHLKSLGLQVESFNGALLVEPWTVQTQAGRPFQVFTPFWRACLASLQPRRRIAAPERLVAPERAVRSDSLESLALLPKLKWADGFSSVWTPGEVGAGRQLERFVGSGWDRYTEDRNRPDLEGTSRLSPHLHFGEISPVQVWWKLSERGEAGGRVGWKQTQYVSELGWREFAHHLLYHFPGTTTRPLRAEFEQFPWKPDARQLEAWQRGTTGYPIVDAGMRELWATGWMHNRVRMIVASFLVKDLLISWQEGARWFWDTLVDADLAQNTLGWQWTAGCGADAAPYFRVFNPTSQGEKFDPDGAYVRRWCPELAGLPTSVIHSPSDTEESVLRRAGVVLGKTYPRPMVDHSAARDAALAAWERIRRKGE